MYLYRDCNALKTDRVKKKMNYTDRCTDLKLEKVANYQKYVPI